MALEIRTVFTFGRKGGSDRRELWEGSWVADNVLFLDLNCGFTLG